MTIVPNLAVVSRGQLEYASNVCPIMGVEDNTGLGHRPQCIAFRTLTERRKTDRCVFTAVEIRDDNPVPRLVGIPIEPGHIFPADAAPADMLALDKWDDAISRVRDAGAEVP